MQSLNGAIARVIAVMAEYGFLSEKFALIGGAHACCPHSGCALSLEWVVYHEKSVEYDGEAETVGSCVRTAALGYLRSHVMWLAGNTVVVSVVYDIVVVANNHISAFGVNDETAVIDVLIAVARGMQAAERVADLQAGREFGKFGVEISVGVLVNTEVFAEVDISFRPQAHYIAIAALIGFGYGKGPKKCVGGRIVEAIVLPEHIR